MVGSRAEAAVTVVHTRQSLTRFANSFIHQNVTDEHTAVSLQLSVDGRPSAASTYRTDHGALSELVESALEAAAVRPIDPSWAGLCPPVALAAGPDVHYDAATAEAGPEWRADVVRRFVDAASSTGDTVAPGATPAGTAAGYCETAVTERVFANSLGHRVTDRYTRAAVDGILRLTRAGEPASDGVGSTYSWRGSDLDPSAAGADAGDRAGRGLDPIELPAGRYEVVLEPRCVGYIVDFLLVYGFNARAVVEDRSFVSLGEEQFDPVLSLVDDATDPRQVGGSFDAEGTPKRRVELVGGGTVTGLAHDRRTAARAGGGSTSTGHAVPGGESFGALATNVFLSGTGARHSGADLVGQVERGLLVSDFWYARVLDPKSLVTTGLTRNGVFLIEDGRPGPAVSNLRYTQSYAAALAPGRVLGVGGDATMASGDLKFALHHVPSLRLAQWNFTGNASG